MALRAPEAIERCDTLFLSPHLDDVGLSCPAKVRGVRRAVVATVFSDGGADHRARRAEDARALDLLGADGVHLGLLDAPFRDPAYTSYTTLCLRRNPGERGDLARVEERLRALVQRLAPAQVFAPLGVGGHVDHRLVHRAARAVVEPSRLAFYEDRPYAFVRGAVAQRLVQLGAREPLPPLVDQLASFARAPHVRAYLRVRELPALVHSLRHADPDPPIVLSPLVERHGLGERSAALAIGLAYGSQWPTLFGGLGAHEALLREAAHALGGDAYAERFWVEHVER